MSMRSIASRLAKLAALLTLFGLSVMLGNCSGAKTGDNDTEPQQYHYGGAAW